MNLLASQHDSSPELSQDVYKIIPLSCRKHSFAKIIATFNIGRVVPGSAQADSHFRALPACLAF